MFTQADNWEKCGDQRYIFQRCYGLMSRNMIKAIADRRFADGPWVERLMQDFASYYFEALELYENHDPRTPAVWRQVHIAAQEKSLHVVQHLLLGVNAHINYDLPLALYDGLQREWASMTETDRQIRKADHETVNQIIGETIDSVQDIVIEPRSPFMALVDRLMGRVDEWLLSKLITAWRADVWHITMDLLSADSPAQQEAIRQSQEKKVLETGEELAFVQMMQ